MNRSHPIQPPFHKKRRANPSHKLFPAFLTAQLTILGMRLARHRAAALTALGKCSFEQSEIGALKTRAWKCSDDIDWFRHDIECLGKDLAELERDVDCLEREFGKVQKSPKVLRYVVDVE
ncbi:hypothetical protein HDV00_000507 [Rhizophlyctis rosea]|nr:hypothetical protein HDV00_000507 [Rhizophlyctis rosea]